ncbi:MAG: hypothetical protein LBI05_07550 [Planctomycetaceae bacterium]|nr:hypothetical protein [Planctomycetaceae bacterium]
MVLFTPTKVLRSYHHAEDFPLAMRRRSLPGVRHIHCQKVIFTRQSRWSVKSTNPPFGGF